MQRTQNLDVKEGKEISIAGNTHACTHTHTHTHQLG